MKRDHSLLFVDLGPSGGRLGISPVRRAASFAFPRKISAGMVALWRNSSPGNGHSRLLVVFFAPSRIRLFFNFRLSSVLSLCYLALRGRNPTTVCCQLNSA